MLGAFSVGKSALVQQFVKSIFSDKYYSTVGVKISKKNLFLDDQEVSLVLWDMEGKDLYVDVNISYLRGAMGYFLVVDGMRRETLDIALELRDLTQGLIGEVPYFLLLNKADKEEQWEVSRSDIERAEARGVTVLKTSAKTAMNVEEAFSSLARAMLA
jgi:small GTP-binding protein